MRPIKFRARDKKTGKLIYFDLFDVWHNTIGGCSSRIVLLDTSELFTGLKDKKGKEIYEGDVLKYAGKRLKVVWWVDRYWGQYKKEAKYPIRFKEAIEVIGNIYEDENLLSK